MGKRYYDNYDYEEAYKEQCKKLEEAEMERWMKEGWVNCLYRTSTYKSTNTESNTTLLESMVYPSFKFKADMPKTEKKRETSPSQSNLNDKNARRYLIRLANINFGKGDIWATFGWNNGLLPETYEDAKKDVKMLLSYDEEEIGSCMTTNYICIPENLTIKQAADDQHEIIQAIRQKIYPASKWISTGISKGGQTTIFHRYFYPADVDISVPYVAPLNLEYVDPRLDKFLNRLGTAKSGVKALFNWEDLNTCHYTIRDFQTMCFEHLDTLLPMLEELAAEKKYTYRMVGGTKRALQLMILEYPFAFWQWGNNCADIPDQESADWEEIFEYLVKVSSPDFFEDKYIVRMQPFFYAALTEIGMYDYKIKPFKKFLPEDDKDIDFSFTMPEGVEKKPFNDKQMKAINEWLQTDAERILFVYGGSDPWYATGVDLKKNGKCRKYVRGDMSHACRIKDFDPVSKEDLLDTLNEWMQEK